MKSSHLSRSSCSPKNRNTKCFFNKSFIQAKLTINQPGDAYEQEADAVSGKVMQMSSTETASTFFQPKPISTIPVQKKESPTVNNTIVTPSAEQTLNSTGQPMDKTTRSFMENRFGYDFGNVQIHNDSLAHRSSSAINALAYTHGNHVVFGKGQYQPNTHSGKKLLAHELAHVVQQSAMSSNQVQTKVIDDKEHLPCRTTIAGAAATIMAAENVAAAMADNAAAVLRQRPFSESARESLWKHFRLDYNDALHRCRFVPAVADRFAQIAKSIRATGITYDCTATGEPTKECATAGAVTWVGLFGGSGMALCSDFWNQVPSQQGVWLLHEWVHYEFGSRGAMDEHPGGFDTAGCYASFAIEAGGGTTTSNEEVNCNANTKSLPKLNTAFIDKVPCPGNVFLNVTGTAGIAVGSFPAKSHFLSTELGIDYLFPLSRLHDWELSLGARYSHFKPSKPEEDSAFSLGARVGLQFRHQPWRFGWQLGGYAEGGGINLPGESGKDVTHPYLGGGVVGGLNIPLGHQSSLQVFVDVGERFGLDTGDSNQIKWFQAGIGIALQAQ